MMRFQDFLHQRLTQSGFSTEDALTSFLPLARQVAAAHQSNMVAPLAGLNDLRVENARIWFEAARLSPTTVQIAAVRAIDPYPAGAVEVRGEFQVTSDVDQGDEKSSNLQIGKRGEEVKRPVYLPGYVSWELEVGHHDPLTDIFSLGMILASLACGLDFHQEENLEEFVNGRRNLFEVNPDLHPVLAKMIVRMTELSRHRRPQDMEAIVRMLENYRDQNIDFDFDPVGLRAWKASSPRDKRGLILSRLQQRLFEISRRNRLLHFRPTMHTVNLTWASVPLSFDVQSIRPDQILIWNTDLQEAIVANKPLSLNKHLRFEEAIYLPSLLDQIRNEARRDQAEFGFAPLRLVLCFLRWSNLKEKPPERFDSPLLLLPVELTKTKGVRDVYSVTALSTEAEVNPVLRYYLKQLYAIDLPECVDLTTDSLDNLYGILVNMIQASEPGVTIDKIDRPRIQLIRAKAQRRLEQYHRRMRLSGRGIRSFGDLDYSYDAANFHPLGLRLFQARIRPPETRLHTLIEDTPRPRTFMYPPIEQPAAEKEKLLYSKVEEEANPFRWELDLCSVTLGNFRYQRMSLVRDYSALLQDHTVHPPFEAIVSVEPRAAPPLQPAAPSLDESYAIVPWDPTQASAIAQARTGQHLIIQGPPGTGKSQTITNLIADYVARGKRVLFVCEKRAAIDVVYQRLRQTGLHDLCCLIHDSQADKKEFILDLKQVYERHLEAQDKKYDPPEADRKQLLTSVQKELVPLQQYHEAMRSSPPQAQVPLRRLIERGTELASVAEPQPQPRVTIPGYSLWSVHGEQIRRVVDLLQEAQQSAILAKHPLRSLNARLATEAEAHNVLHQKLTRIDGLLNTLEQQLQESQLPESVKDTLQKVMALTAFAAQARFLAEQNQIALLCPTSELAKSLAKFEGEWKTKAKELEKAQAANKAWVHKLPSDETQFALEQAKALQHSAFRVLKPAWWRLRSVFRRCYDFRSHAIRPNWIHVLESLTHEHACQGELDKVETAAREVFKFDGDLPSFAARVSSLSAAMSSLPDALQGAVRSRVDLPQGDKDILHLARMQPTVDELNQALTDLLELDKDLSFAELREELALVEESQDELADFLPCLKELATLPAPLARAWRFWPGSIVQLEAAMARRTLEDIFRSNRTLARFSARTHAKHVQKLENTYDALHAINAAVVRDSVRHRFLDHIRIASSPHAQLTPEQKELKTLFNKGRRALEHEFGKTMRFRSIRDLVADNSGIVLRDLKPVWLMSPLSVSDTLPLDHTHFDVVIFDEASQVTLEEAVPAIFRAQQIIVVGDEMQLPPTNFFSAKHDDEEEALVVNTDEGQTVELDLSRQSLLNHAARNLPSTMLGWHYRSRSESLISFSNAAFYQGRLLTVPEVTLSAAQAAPINVRLADEGLANVSWILDRPVSFHFLENGLYQQRRNAAEADYIAHIVKGLLARESNLSIGIIAFSEAQQSEIQEALERLARQDSVFRDRLEAEIEREDDGQAVGLLVKNLENIQGDERDLVILSVCYGSGPGGKMLMNFGPINQSGGERRLNVAFSRAKQHMVLVTSIKHHAVTNDYNDGARCLKSYLRYAEALSTADEPAALRVLWEMSYKDQIREPEKPADFVIADLAAALVKQGYEITSPVGQSSFRCDLAVRKPGDPAYRLGILIDTASYYDQEDILGRDVLKPKLLRAFGWNVMQVLTKDWYENASLVLSRIEQVMSGALPDEEATESADEQEHAQTIEATANLTPTESSKSNQQLAAITEKPLPTVSQPQLSGASSDWQRSFEYVEGSSRKFWTIQLHGNEHTVHFGRIGTTGQRKTKSFANPNLAENDARRLINEKLAKGYVEKRLA